MNVNGSEEVKINFDANGLVPCIVQDAKTGAVLTLAYMNEESFAKTRETGETWFYSRSRQKLWHKGEESGNIQKVLELRYDCDEDALLALVDPTGPACHTGEITCFYRSIDAPAKQLFEAPGDLQRTLDERRRAMPEGSYTTQLLNDPPFIAEKVLEEAEEVTRAAREETDDRVANEAADVIYHLAVLMTQRGLSIQDAFAILNERAAPSA
jgi:phosphoribosyl-ATP pyrophosphohydrolase/phosphoribosyl-AMP cyclohydrolase